jgi:LuxR family transcriptional regulator, maltose regulon positive regulatory protein
VTDLLVAKLSTPPLRSSLAPRPALIARLNAGQVNQLTLLSAPAGYGKTTLLAEWLAQLARPTAWLSLDEAENDPHSFFRYLAAAVAPLPGVGQATSSALPATPAATPATLARAFLQDVTAVTTPFNVILDDYHLIEATAVDEALTFILDHLPAHVHLVIATRTDPLLPLARLRARGQMNEIRVNELRFSASEARHFLTGVMELPLSDSDVAVLETRTEGWIAGLQLAALSLRGAPDTAAFIHHFAGSHRYIMDYLTDEVLRRQPAAVQHFLLRTAVLNRLTATLCEALVADADGQAMLDYLERANLFLLPSDGERRWYRYHRLFADLLLHRLQQGEPELLPRLHQRASAWYAQQAATTGGLELANEAINHALAAGQPGAAAELAARFGELAWRRGDLSQLARWLKLLPEIEIGRRPILMVLDAWLLFAAGHDDQAGERLAAVTTMADPADKVLMGKVTAVRAYIATFKGDFAATIGQAQESLDLLPAEASAWRASAAMALADAYSFTGQLTAAATAYRQALLDGWAAGNGYLALLAAVKLALAQRQQGQLVQVMDLCRQQLALAVEHGLTQTIMAGCLHAIWSETLCEENELDQALLQAREGIRFSRQALHVGMLGWCYLYAARVFLTVGEFEVVAEMLRHVDQVAQETHLPPWMASPLAGLQATLWLAQDHVTAVATWAQQRQLDAHAPAPAVRAGEYLPLVRFYLRQGQFAEAAMVSERLLTAVGGKGYIAPEIEVLLLLALANQGLQKFTAAQQHLTQALTLAAPAGFLRAFVDKGEPMAQLLAKVKDEGRGMKVYREKVLAAFVPAQLAGRPHTDLTEPLSEREQEVLQLIAAGLGNKAIADRLFITVNTVLYHTKNIYSKLAVNKRTQAVARAREMKLI